MSEEEKQAIEELKSCIFFWQGQLISSDKKEDEEIAKKEININKTLLNLIEKQQKEIAELKEEINYWKECAEGEAGLRKQIQEDYQEQMQELLESEGI